jgi:thiol-disulfide isomerase/thioredoxin
MASMHASLKLGDQLPPLNLPDPAGTTHDLAQLADGRPALVIFLCNHCPYVKHVAPALGELGARWSEQGVAVIAVNSNDVQRYPADAPAHMDEFASAHHWSFPYVHDEDQSVAESFGAMCTPDAFLFDAGHRLAYRGQLDSSRPSNGVPVTGEDLDAAIAAVLGGQAPAAEQRPSVGCSIKWKPGNGPS